MNNYNDIFEKLKRVFTSDKNCNYILQLIAEHSALPVDVQQYKPTLAQLQSMIYDTYIQQICNDLGKQGKLNLEEVLIILNKITIDRFQTIITRDNNTSIKDNPTNDTNYTEPNNYVSIGHFADTATINTTANSTNTTNTTANTITANTAANTTNTNTAANTDIKHPTATTVHHFFSEDATLKSGRYTFPFVMNNIKSIDVSCLKINCNIYNVTDANNKFLVMEGSQKINISIPIGYYTTDNLCKAMSELLNHHSINKYKYQLFRNSLKNKVYFQCNIKDSKPAVFSVRFSEAATKNELGLGEMLGFQQSEYINNNIYVSESNPVDNVLENVYLKVFVNDKEIPRITTTRNGFSYFKSYSIDMNQQFGKQVTISTDPMCHEIFEVTEQLDCHELSIELWNNTQTPITRSTEFECVFTFEHTLN